MKKTEICLNCGDDYVPNRRGAQKFCRNSCRSRFWTLKQKKLKVPVPVDNLKSQLPDAKSDAIKQSMTLAGVGEAAAGVALVELGKTLIIPKDNKPATKRDIQELKSMINGERYLPVKNYQNDADGRKPFYDVETGKVVYL